MLAHGNDITTDQLVHELDQLYVIGNTVQLAILSKIAEIDRAHAWREDGAKSMDDWLCFRYGMAFATARDEVALADALSERPVIAASYGCGRLSRDKISDLCSFVAVEDEASYAAEAEVHNAAQVRMWARHARSVSRSQAERAQRLRYLRASWDRRGEFLELRGRIPGVEGATVRKALDRIAEQLGPSEDGTWGPVDERRADALVELAGTRIDGDADTDRATIVVHADESALAGEDGTSFVEDGPVLATETLRRVACDGRVQYVWHAADGTPVGVGRTARVVPAWMLRLLKKRDGGCVACGRSVGCQAHHVEHWAQGGKTDLDNLVLLCRRCHRLVHEHGFRLARDQLGHVKLVRPDGHPVANRPAPLRPDIKERIIGVPARNKSPAMRC